MDDIDDAIDALADGETETDGLDLATSICERWAYQDRGDLQATYLRALLGSPWPHAGRLLSILKDEQRYRPDYATWDELLEKTGIDAREVSQILHVFNALLDLRLDPERYAEIPVERIAQSLGPLKRLPSRAEQSTFLQNLGK